MRSLTSGILAAMKFASDRGAFWRACTRTLALGAALALVTGCGEPEGASEASAGSGGRSGSEGTPSGPDVSEVSSCGSLSPQQAVDVATANLETVLDGALDRIAFIEDSPLLRALFGTLPDDSQQPPVSG